MKQRALLFTCAAAVLCVATGAFAKSPSEEFEEKMRPHRKPEFVLPAAADSQLQEEHQKKQQQQGQAPQVRVMDIGRRYQPNQGIGSDSERLGEAIRHERSQEQRNRPSTPPAPRRIVCEGNPPTCMER